MTLRITNLQRIRARLAAELDAAAQETAEDIMQLARQFVPVDTGALRSTIRIEAGARQGERRVIAGGLGVVYARYVEYGARNSPAQPYMAPAAANIDRTFRARARLRKLIGG